MTSTDAAEELLDKLSFLGGADPSAAASSGFGFDLDFTSPLVWPDMPYDTSSPSACYAEESRSEIVQILESARNLLSDRAPKALSFVDQQLDSVLMRRSAAIDSASSSSNRKLVGFCLLTNIHIPPERAFVCSEGLVHEAIHQYMYRAELQEGNFCDLSPARTYRSPWSGNRIPLHSLVHASFVWFGLLNLWCQAAQGAADPQEILFIRERIGRSLFGYVFLRELMDGPAFPRDSVRPEIIELIEHIAQIGAAGASFVEGYRTVHDSLQVGEHGACIAHLTSRLALISRNGPARTAAAQQPRGASIE